jgi:hypothetical protein
MQINVEYNSIPALEELASDLQALAFPISVEIRQGVACFPKYIPDDDVDWVDCDSVKDLHDYIRIYANGHNPIRLNILDDNEEVDI